MASLDEVVRRPGRPHFEAAIFRHRFTPAIDGDRLPIFDMMRINQMMMRYGGIEFFAIRALYVHLRKAAQLRLMKFAYVMVY
jgi:hypothetical protein